MQHYAPIGIAADINLIETKESVHTKASFNAIFLHQNYRNRVEFCHKIVIRVTGLKLPGVWLFAQEEFSPKIAAYSVNQ